MSTEKKKGIIRSAWGTTFGIMKRYPRTLVPLGVHAFLQFVILVLLFWAPRPPISIVLAPPIRRFWGEIYLHYPFNFLLLPKVFNYCNILFGITVGVMMLGMTVNMVAQANKEMWPGLRTNFKKTLKKYLTLVAVWLLLFALEAIIFKGPRFLIIKYYSRNTGFFNQINLIRMGLIGGILISVIIETLFAFAIPSVIIEHKRFYKALKRSLSVIKGVFLPTFVLVLVPLLLNSVVILLKWNLPQLMDRFFPEVTLYIMGLGIIVSFFASFLLITSVTTLFLRKIETEDKGALK